MSKFFETYYVEMIHISRPSIGVADDVKTENPYSDYDEALEAFNNYLKERNMKPVKPKPGSIISVPIKDMPGYHLQIWAFRQPTID